MTRAMSGGEADVAMAAAGPTDAEGAAPPESQTACRGAEGARPEDIVFEGLETESFKIVVASVIGPGHRKKNQPRQDSYAIGLDEGRNRVAVVLCDGAGSARRAETGARIVAETVRDALLAAEHALPDPDETGRISKGPWRETAETAVLRARETLAEISNADSEGGALAPYHATLVATLVSSESVLFLHVGDGFAAAVDPQVETDQDAEIAAWERPLCASEAENGEYDNETYFVTEDDWRDRLRVTAAGRAPVVVLITDGPDAFALTRDQSGLAGPLWRGVHAFLDRTPAEDGARALAGTLDSQQARAPDAGCDDKTVAWIRLRAK